MSKTKKIIHTTFWFNNIWQGAFILAVLFANLKRYDYATFAVLIGFFVAFLESFTLKKVYNVKIGSTINLLDFISDERDKDIAYKVHTKLMTTYQLIIWVAIIFANDFLYENHLLFIVWIALALYIPILNIMYYGIAMIKTDLNRSKQIY